MKTEILNIAGTEFTAVCLPTEHGVILLIQGRRANLGCGYFSMAPADRIGDRFAVITGVKSFADMLAGTVVAASSAALAVGVVPGSTSGEAALLAMENN